MVDFRPISLCNVVYKIVSKALANRLCMVLGEVIFEEQSAFVPGRLITDNAIIGFECLYALRTKKRENGSIALKLDMSKAYDRVEWDYVSKVMQKLGFSERWIQRVMDCVRTVRFSFLINGTMCGSFVPSRGLRQGDMLSPYLYLLVSEGLSGLIRVAMDQNVYTGFRCWRTGPVISHLFFADDSLLLLGATTTECLKICRILDVYSRSTRQLVNFETSGMCQSYCFQFGGGTFGCDHWSSTS
ncbi:hypothetical protein Dsin_027839 [Dipteronia sinensis]|uniref:Reverse transcriptase domain-containing protein n=1 Tax=Dipteronia sinensis TaxID=43782 RepID=A0AAD9ZP77_9ROSI|nr:hypothetical protein Dsin_027839 [Dipteronia sinensis]